MTKLCSVCGTENREEAQFCRACGTAFAAPASRSATSDDDTATNVCAECGFRNKPGLRYCANCGVGLAAATAGGGAAVGEESGGGPPPISYPSFAPVGPYPPAPPSTVPEIPDADAEIALRQQEADESGNATLPFGNTASPSRAPLLLGIVALVLVVGGALAWTFMRDSNSSPPAIGATTPPVAAPLPATSAAAPPIAVEATPASDATAATSPAAAETAPPAATAEVLGPPPAAAPPLPHIGDAVPAATSPQVEAKRLAAEKRRERAAREKTDREAKALAEREQQSAAAAQRAEQEAAARRRADEAQRARSAAVAAPPPPAAAPPRGVREICAGRNAISEAICQSRECGHAEHAGEAICRQIRAQEEQRRNMQP
jgi:hypothetical protein